MADILEVIDQAAVIETEEKGAAVEIADHGYAVELSESGVIVDQGGGASDHGDLAGLGDDDHPHYLTAARGDLRYDPAGASAAAVAGHAAAADPHPQYLTSAEGNAAYEIAGASAAAVAGHLAAGDPHPQYLTGAEGNAAYELLGASAAALAAHLAAGDPHPQYLTLAEGNAAYEAAGTAAAHLLASDPHPQYLTPAEGDAAYGAALASAAFQPLISHLMTEQTDCAYVWLGDSLILGATRMAQRQAEMLMVKHPAWTFKVAWWNDGTKSHDAPVTLQAGTGPRICTCYIGAVSGRKAGYLMDDSRFAAVINLAPLLVIACYGHNHSFFIADYTPVTYDFLDLIANIRDAIPVPIILIGQTPTTDSNVQEARAEWARTLAGLTGCGFIDLHGPMWGRGRPAADYSDTVHLSAQGSTWAASLIDRHAIHNPALNPPVSPAICSGAGDLLNFDKTAGGWTLINTTAASTSVAGEFETGGAALKLTTTTGASAGFIYKDVITAADIARFRGKYITLLVRKRVLAGNPISCGRLAVYTAAGETAYSDGSTLRGTKFTWQTSTLRVPEAANFVRVYIYNSGVAGQLGEMFIDRMYLVPGFAGTDGGPHRHLQSEVINLPADLALKAPLASPIFTGVPAAPTAAPGTNTTQLSTTAFVQAAIAALIASSPAALDTLNELAAALGNDANFATTMTTALAGKAPTVHSHTAAQISDATAAGRALLLAADAAAQTALLNTFTTALKGLVPSPGPPTGKYLRDDGSWSAPAGGGGSQEVYVQQARPIAAGPWAWWETDGTGRIIDLTVNDGA